ncbi:CHAT domain-containing protein, partial [Crucibulum laeve]
MLQQFVDILHIRYDVHHLQDDLNERISAYRILVQLLPVIHPQRAVILLNFALALRDRLIKSPRREDVEEANAAYQDALDLDPELRSASSLHILANIFGTRFNLSHDHDDMHRCIHLHLEVLALRPTYDPERYKSLLDLAFAMNIWYFHSCDLMDLDEAISLYRQCLSLQSQQHPDRSKCLTELANALSLRVLLASDQPDACDLHEAVALHREAVSIGPLAMRTTLLDKLASTLGLLYELYGCHQNLDRAIDTYRDALNGLPAVHCIEVESLSDLIYFLEWRFSESRGLEDITEIILLQRSISSKLQGRQRDSLDALSHSFSNLAHSLLRRFKILHEIADLDEVIVLLDIVFELQPRQHPSYLATLQNLANARYTRFGHLQRRDDLDAMIPLRRELLAMQPDSHVALFYLANALQNLAIVQGSVPDSLSALDEAITLYRKALRIQSDYRFLTLGNLVDVVHRRFSITDDVADLHDTILLSQEALQLPPHFQQELRPEVLKVLAQSLRSRFKLLGDPQDLDDEIEVQKELLHLPDMPDYHRFRASDYLVLALLARCRNRSKPSDDFEVRPITDSQIPLSECDISTDEQMDDFVAAIDVLRVALKLSLSPNDRLWMLSNFSHLLRMYYKRTFLHGMRLVDLDELIAVYQELLQSKDSAVSAGSIDSSNLAKGWLYAAKSSSDLSNQLGHAFRLRFEISGLLADIDASVFFYESAVELEEFKYRSPYLTNVAKALHIRFRQTNHRDDLDRAVSSNREALALLPPDPMRPDYLTSLADVLFSQSRLLANRANTHEYLREAVSLYRQALDIKPTLLHCVVSLANALGEVSKKAIDGDAFQEEAIMWYRTGLALQPESDYDQVVCGASLAAALSDQFDRSGSREDLDASISELRKILLVPKRHFDQPMIIANLAYALAKRSKAFHSRDDLEEAIDLFDQSMSLLPATHPSICNIAYNLGFTLKDGYAQFHDNDYLTSSRLAFERAAKCDFAFTYDRFIAARQWAIHEDRDDSNALEAYRCVIGLLPRLATLEFSLETRREMLNANSDGLARDAMACAVRLKDFEKAIELLEEGRAVFWSQALQLRTPMDELHSVAPVLQTKLRDISAILEQGSHRISSAPDPSLPRNMQPIEEEERQLRRLNDEWLATLEEVRGIPDFEDFLRPRRFHHLQSAASPGETIIVINGSEQSTDALIMTSDELTHIPLPNIPFTKAQTLVKLVQAGSTTGRDISHSEAFIPYAHTIVDDIPDFEDVLATSRGGKVARKSRSRSDEIFIYVLATLWDGIVKPIVRHLNLEKTDKPTRVWWCPTGPFTFLPLHAAGHYEGAMIECAPEYIMSSYTPSIGALLQSKNIPVLSHTPKFQMMAVVQPEVLPFTVLELEKIKDHVPSESLVKLGVSDIDASVETVISHLKTVSIAHFACHGRQDLRNPLESSLILDDGDLEVSRIMQLHMPNASLAFLCACQTAMGAEDLPEEAIHLGATLLFAGFRAVIATM